MTRQSAERVVAELQGWTAPRIDEDEWGDCVVTAIDPISHRRMIYNPCTGHFDQHERN